MSLPRSPGTRLGSIDEAAPSAQRVLLTVSGTIPEDLLATIAAGRRPRADYIELAKTLDADLLDHGGVKAASSVVTRLIARLAGANVAMAWMCARLRRKYDVILTDGEQIGLPLAAIARLARSRGRARHIMIVHIMSVPKKTRLFRALRLAARIDAFIVYATSQRRFLSSQLGVSTGQIFLQPFLVDTKFFNPANVVSEPRQRPMICTAGLECRDYPTLLVAVEGLEADIVIAAASPWSKRSSGLEGLQFPPNVTVVRLDLFQLRQLYADASFVVMPLQPVDFQAGITTILEAMSMARAVVCTGTSGQTDTIVDGETGSYTPPGDAVRMRRAIQQLLGDPDRAIRQGRAARAWVLKHADIEIYAHDLAAITDRFRTP